MFKYSKHLSGTIQKETLCEVRSSRHMCSEKASIISPNICGASGKREAEIGLMPIYLWNVQIPMGKTWGRMTIGEGR